MLSTGLASCSSSEKLRHRLRRHLIDTPRGLAIAMKYASLVIGVSLAILLPGLVVFSTRPTKEATDRHHKHRDSNGHHHHHRGTVGESRVRRESSGLPREQAFAGGRSEWELKHGAFPGRKEGGFELDCTVAASDMDHANAFRKKFLQSWLNWLRKHDGGMLRVLRGLEVGACGMPVRVDDSLVKIEYLDSTGASSNSHCFKGALVAVQIVDDAQKMQKVTPGTYDFLMGFHVLEHLGDFFGAIKAWVRSVRMGGLVLFALPSPCDRQYVMGESLRLVTDPQHFAREFGQPMRVASNAAEHMRESAVAMWGMGLSNLPMQQQDQSSAERKARVERCSVPIRKAWRAWNVSETIPPAQWRELPHGAMQPEHFDCLVQNVFADDPNRAHLHVWTLSSLRNALALARRAMAADMPFDVLSAVIAPRTSINMEELRVVLRRQQPRKPF